MNKDELKNLYPKMPEQFMETVNKSVSDGLTVNGKVIRMKKKIFLIIAATLLLGVSVYAAGKAVGIISTSNALTDFTDAEEIPDKEDDIGVKFKYVDEFDNGYIFRKGWITNTSEIDENNVSLKDYKELTLVYSDNDADMYVIISPDEKESDTEDGVISQRSQLYKNVPLDYEMTEQDIEDQENGVYEFSTGDLEKEVTVTEMRFVSWHEDGVSYLIMQYGDEISFDDMKAMAEEIMAAE